MLSASEFTVGSIGKAIPLTLVLPRHEGEEAILIARCSCGPAALFLSENHRFQWFASAHNEHWHGLLVAGVRIEVDETSIFDPARLHAKLGTVVRQGTQLVAQAKPASNRSVNGFEPVVLEDGLAATTDEAAGFHRWRIVIGSGRDKRVLHEVSIAHS